jgi:hypothetical protein
MLLALISKSSSSKKRGVSAPLMSKMIEKEQKETIIKLDESQYKYVLVALNNISRDLISIADKVEKLESAITKIEGELKLIRMEVSELKQKK